MLQDTVSDVISRYGRKYTLARRTVAAGANSWTEGASTEAFYPCVARRRARAATDLRAGVPHKYHLLVIDAASLSVTPQVGDMVALGTHVALGGAIWHEITDVDDPADGDDVPLYRCRVAA